MARVDHALVERIRARLASGGRRDDTGNASLRDAVCDIVDAERLSLSAGHREVLVQAVIDTATGLGPLEPLLRDPTVTEVMVNGPSRVYVERGGRLEPTEVTFRDEAHVRHVADRILSAVGRRVDEGSPLVDARLADGSRVNVVIPPLAVDGSVITIRRFGERTLTIDDLVDLGSLDGTVRSEIQCALGERRNILVSGGTGSGKTTTLSAIAGLLPRAERVITIEDAAELRLDHPHVVRLESRPTTVEGRGEVPIRALVRNALRMRPDRIIVGEVRGGEALDMLQALATGHDGSLSTIHASSPADALRRLVTLALMGDVDLPHRAVADQVGAAIHLIVHQARSADGTRRLVELARVEGRSDGPTATTVLRWESGPGPGTWRRP